MRACVFFFCTVIFASVPSSLLSQSSKIKIDEDKVITIDEVFDLIMDQTEYKFFYEEGIFDDFPKVKLKKGNISANKLLNRSLKGNLEITIAKDNLVVIKEKPHLEAKTQRVQQTVSGTVTDKNGLPLPGASILEKGTFNGTQTDFEGNFTIEVQGSNAILVISYIGFATQEIPLNDQTQLNVSLTEDVAGLDEVVVVGYGAVKKSDLTGAVSSVKAEDLSLAANTSVDQALISKAAGLTILQGSAQPGGGADVLIRGAANVGASNAPLYVIDGFPITGGVEPGGGNAFGNAGFRSPLNDINPNDIASIEVLKDASATAIYGARAANGVILITTKRGEKGTPKINYSSNYGIQTSTKWLDLLNAREYRTVRNELSVLNGEPEVYTAEEIASAGEGTDWFEELTRSGYIHQQNISVSGGNEVTKYLASFNYFDQEGILKNNALTRFSGRLNLDQKISERVKWGLSFTASEITNDNIPLGSAGIESGPPLVGAIDFNPTIPIRDENGNFSRHEVLLLTPNPVSLLDITDQTVTDRLLANFFVDINLAKGLDASAKVGVDRRNGVRSSFLPTTTVAGADLGGDADKSYIKRNDKLVGLTLTYNKEIGNHSFTVLGGYEYQEFNIEEFNAGNNQFVTDGLLFNALEQGTGVPVVGSGKSVDELASYFGRVNYRFKDRYLLTASIRADGSPQFGSNNRWGVFPSASFAWRVINEDFMVDNGIFSNLKLRVGYGQTGNRAGGATALFGVTDNFVFGIGSGTLVNTGVRQTRLENPNLRWQTNTELNLGLDFGFFNNRLSGTVEYFSKDINNLLSTRQLRSFLPISTITDNIGSTTSKGIEVTLQSTIVNSNDITWSADFNLGAYRDRWKERNPEVPLRPHEQEDDFIRSIFTLEFDGIQQVGDPIPEHQPDIQPGQVRVKDLRGTDDDGNLTEGPDGRITDADLVFQGTSDPGFSYGFGSNLRYKNLDFSFFFQGVADRLRFNDTNAAYLIRADRIRAEGVNGLRGLLDRWTPDNPSTTQPSGLRSATPGAENALFLEKGDFLRLRNVTLGYSFPDGLFGNVVKQARIYAEAQNLFVITDYSGIDPEIDSIGAYPNQRSVSLGVNVTF